MGRPPTNPTKLKDGYYLEIRNIGSKSGIKIRRDNEQEMINAKEQYERSKTVIVLGEYRDGKPFDAKAKAKKKAAAEKKAAAAAKKAAPKKAAAKKKK
jgi:topoisomerase IA-like protein